MQTVGWLFLKKNKEKSKKMEHVKSFNLIQWGIVLIAAIAVIVLFVAIVKEVLKVLVKILPVILIGGLALTCAVVVLPLTNKEGS